MTVAVGMAGLGSGSASAQAPSKRVVVMLHDAEVDEGGMCGAGIIVYQDDSRTLVVTARHNLFKEDDKTPVSVVAEFASAEGQKLRATPLPSALDGVLDLAVLEIRATPVSARLSPREFALLPRTTEDRGLTTIGQPECENWTMSLDVALMPDPSPVELRFQATAVATGNSGGALFYPDGSLAGMIVQGNARIGRALPIAALVSRLREFGLPTKLTLAPEPEVRPPSPPAVEPPTLDRAYRFSGYEVSIRTNAAIEQRWNGTSFEMRELPGTLMIYGTFGDGRKYLLATNPPSSTDLPTRQLPDGLISCGIVSDPLRPGSYKMLRQQWTRRDLTTESTYEVTKSAGAGATQDPKACVERAEPLSALTRLRAVIDVTDLPFAVFSASTIMPLGQQAIIFFSPEGGGLERVSGGRAAIFVRQRGRWVRAITFNEPFEFDNGLDVQRHSVPVRSLAGERIAICTYRTLNGETFAGWSEFLPQLRPDGKLRSVADTIYRASDPRDPCADFLR